MSEPLGHTEHSTGTPASKKADKRKQTILVITGVVGVALTYLLWRHSTSAASSSSDYAQPSGVSADGSTSGGGADYSAAMNSIGSELTTMQGQLQSQQSAYSNLEDEFNSKIDALTQTQQNQGAQIHNQAEQIINTTQSQGAQINHLATVVQQHEQQTKTLAHTVAAKNTSQTKKKTK